MASSPTNAGSDPPALRECLRALQTAEDPLDCLRLYGPVEQALKDEPAPASLKAALNDAGLQMVRRGARPALILAPSRGELWCGGEAVASMGRSKLLFRLLDFVAVHGSSADRETLYTTVWDQMYLGESSDNTVHVAVNRLRQKLKQSDVRVVPTTLGAFRIEGDPAVLRWSAGAAATPAPVASPTNLTPLTDPIIGRADALDRIRDHFRDGGRILTVVGSGGAGKTRLVRAAGRIASHASNAPPGGIWFVDLSEKTTPEGVVEAIAEVIDVSLKSCATAEAALKQLCRGINDHADAWIILDNFEQLVDSSSRVVAELVSHAPLARFLITSREHLSLTEESILKLDPLSEEEGAELFIRRARAIRPSLEQDDTLTQSARAIGLAVDGIPLAIELAAARSRVLSPNQILERLSEALALLAAPNRAGPSRHSTLRATLNWSWDLLKPWEQSTLAQLSIFQGGFTVDAAEKVVRNHEDPDTPWMVDILESLIDQSLLHMMEGPGEARLTMYRSVQEFGKEKLGEQTSVPDLTQRHIGWIVEEGEHIGTQLFTAAGSRARQALRKERDNLFAAHQAATRPKDIIRCTLVLAHLLRFTGPPSTLLRVVKKAEGVATDLPLDAAELAVHRGWVLHHSGDTAAAEALMIATITDLETTQDVRILSKAYRVIGDINYDQGDFPDAESQLKRAADLAGMAGLRAEEGRHRTTLGSMFRLINRKDEARESLEAGLHIHREVGDARYEAIALAGLASLAHLLGSFEEALERNGEALKIFQESGDKTGESHLLENIGNLHMSMGHIDEAMDCYERSMETARARGMILHQASIATNLAMAHLDVGELVAAEDLLRAALKAHRRHGRRLYEGAALIRLSMVLIERGRNAEATPLLMNAIEVLDDIQARRFAAYGRCWLGLTLAMANESQPAQTQLGQASGAFKDEKDAIGGSLCEIIEGILHPEQVAARIARAREKGPPSGDHPQGSPAAAEKSADIRLAIRIVERIGR